MRDAEGDSASEREVNPEGGKTNSASAHELKPENPASPTSEPTAPPSDTVGGGARFVAAQDLAPLTGTSAVLGEVSFPHARPGRCDVADDNAIVSSVRDLVS